MTTVATPVQDIRTADLTRIILVARSLARRTDDAGTARILEAVADAVELEEKRRMTGRGPKLIEIHVDDADDDPATVDRARQLAIAAAASLRSANTSTSAGPFWGAVAASLADARDDVRHAVDALGELAAPMSYLEGPCT